MENININSDDNMLYDLFIAIEYLQVKDFNVNTIISTINNYMRFLNICKDISCIWYELKYFLIRNKKYFTK